METTPLPGGLYVVGTPLGNLGDVSDRAKSVLGNVQQIACEDTRVTRRLLQLLEVACPTLRPLHEHNEQAMVPLFIEALKAGHAIALVSDAGMPGISDPGFRLVRQCRAEGLPVFAVPGATALTTALAISGLPSDQFAFFGFLPPKTAARRRHLEAHAESPATLIYYESTHRIHKFVDDIIATLGPDRVIAIARELTKLHETVHVGPAAIVKARLEAGSSKGEFVVLVSKSGYTL